MTFSISKLYCRWSNITHIYWMQINIEIKALGEFTPSYNLHTRAFATYLLGGVIYLTKKIIRWWYFTCRKPKNIICDGNLHINMFYYFKISYFTCTFFTKFTYNEYIGPYFLLHIVLRFSPVNSPRLDKWPFKIHLNYSSCSSTGSLMTTVSEHYLHYIVVGCFVVELERCLRILWRWPAWGGNW